MDPDGFHFDLPRRAPQHSNIDLFQDINGLIEQEYQTFLVPSMHALDVNYHHDTGNRIDGSEYPIYPQNNSNCNYSPGFGEAQATQPRGQRRYRESPSNPATAAPDYWASGISRSTQPSGSRTSETVPEIYDSDGVPSNFYLADNLDGDTSRTLGFDGDPAAVGEVYNYDDIGGLGVNYPNRNQWTELLMESWSLPDLRGSAPRPEYYLDGSRVSAGRHGDYGTLEPHRLTDDSPVRYNSQLVSSFVGRQDTQILNGAQQGSDVSRIPLELVGEGASQRTATPIERAGDIQNEPKQKSCWHCRFKHERCKGGTPCDNCKCIMERKGHYLYTVPCFRNDLGEFYRPLFPATMARRIWPCNWFRQYADVYRKKFPGVLRIPLSVGFGKPIWLLGAMFDTQREDLRKSPRLETATGKSTVVSESVLPILAVGKTRDLVCYICSWIDDTSRHPYLLSSWVTVSEKNMIHSPASGSVLRAICRYYTECDIAFAPSGLLEPSVNIERQNHPNNTLQHSMKVAMLATVLSTCISITPEGLQELEAAFQSGPGELSRKWMIPRVMNKWFKYAVCRYSLVLTKNALIGLNKLLRQKDILEGHVASIVALLTTAISATQLSLVDVCHTTQGSETAVKYEHVKGEIFEMEHVFSKLCCLFHRRCKIETIRSQQRYSELDNKTKDLVDNLSNTIPALRENTSQIRGLEFENMEHIHDLKLGNNVPEDVALHNADRLFCALLAPMLTDDRRKRRRRN